MDPISRKLLEELEQMQQRQGRMLRGMSLARMVTPAESGAWQPAADLYESEDRLYVYIDLAGVVGESLRVTIDDCKLAVSGVRRLPLKPGIACIHQLEIELGAFHREVPLPALVDVATVESTYTNGLLEVQLPKQLRPGKVKINIAPGE